MYSRALPLERIEWFLLICLFWDLVVGRTWRFPYSLLWLPTNFLSSQVRQVWTAVALACWESSTSPVFLQKNLEWETDLEVFDDDYGLLKRITTTRPRSWCSKVFRLSSGSSWGSADFFIFYCKWHMKRMCTSYFRCEKEEEFDIWILRLIELSYLLLHYKHALWCQYSNVSNQ